MSFSGITKQLTNDAVEGGILYAAIKGYKVANHMAGKFLPATFTGPLRNVTVALGYAVLADYVAPKKYQSLFGIAAMSEAIAAFVDPFVDPMLVKSDLIGLASLSTLSSYNVGVTTGAIAATVAAPMSGYARINGYGSARMNGYGGSSLTYNNMEGLGRGNMLGFGGANMLGLPC